MALTRYKLRDLIEQTEERNTTLEYDEEDVRGMTIAKTIIPTKADVDNADLSKFLIVHPREFIYNPRTHGKRIGLGFNNTDTSFLISWNNISFRVKDAAKSIVIPEYLFLNFNRDEWDRHACFDSWGSSTEVFSWEALSDMEIDIPDIKVQQKYVDIFVSMVENQKSYEKGLEDIKLLCDAYIEELRRKYPCEKIEKYIIRSDLKNSDNKIKNVKGISVCKEFRDPTSKVNADELSKYKICKPRQIAFVQTTHNEKVFAYAFNNTTKDIVVSSVNEVFSTDESKLLPEYLCMFFNRTEFDRYARFNSWGSARETFTWNDLMEIRIPIPKIEVQKSISEIYTVYKTRKDINEKLKSQIKSICPILIKGSLEESKDN